VYVAGVATDAGAEVVAFIAEPEEDAPALEAGDAQASDAEAEEPKEA